MEIILSFASSFLGNVIAWWWVFKMWKFPKIVVVPVSENDPWLERFREARVGGPYATPAGKPPKPRFYRPSAEKRGKL